MSASMETLIRWRLVFGSHAEDIELAQRELAKAIADRDVALRRAFEQGVAPAELARSCGLSRQRVHRILQDP